MSSLTPRADDSKLIRKPKEILTRLPTTKQRRRSGLSAAGTRLAQSRLKKLMKEGWWDDLSTLCGHVCVWRRSGRAGAEMCQLRASRAGAVCAGGGQARESAFDAVLFPRAALSDAGPHDLPVLFLSGAEAATATTAGTIGGAAMKRGELEVFSVIPEQARLLRERLRPLVKMHDAWWIFNQEWLEKLLFSAYLQGSVDTQAVLERRRMSPWPTTIVSDQRA
jgi:hypothetical protein